MENVRLGSPQVANGSVPVPPSLPTPSTSYNQRGFMMNGSPLKGYSCVSTATKDLWENLFDSGYKADVIINTDFDGVIYAHGNILVSLLILPLG